MVENIYYITGTIFFSLSIMILAVVLIYCVKILQKIIAIESEIKNTVSEVKNKISTFSIGLAGMIALLEKLVQMKDKMKKSDSDNNDAGSQTDSNQKKGSRKIAVH